MGRRLARALIALVLVSVAGLSIWVAAVLSALFQRVG